MSDSNQSRRDFIKTTTAATAGFTLAMSSAASYARILGANDRIGLALIGCGGRGEHVMKNHLSGVRVDLMVVATYAIAGGLAAFSGFILVARTTDGLSSIACRISAICSPLLSLPYTTSGKPVRRAR